MLASRRIRPEALHYLPLRRGFNRSINAIEHKVVIIVQKSPYLKFQSDWNLEAVVTSSDPACDNLMAHVDICRNPGSGGLIGFRLMP
jgi:hypothetical protein